jgi:anti-sigma28 factor (negative regulator of flagellin synthesis)
MRLNMNQPGTKNFNFNINATNMNKDWIGWQEAENLYNGNIYLHLDAQDTNHLNEDQETTVILGTVKITFSVLTRIQDYLKVREPTKKMTTEEEVNELKEKIKNLELKGETKGTNAEEKTTEAV